LQRLDRGCDRDSRRPLGGKAIDAGGDGGKGNRSKAVALAQRDGADIARRQRLVFALAAVVPDRTNGMNHVPGGKPVRQGDFGPTGFAAVKRAAFGEKAGASSAMDRAIDATPTKQGSVRGVDNGVNAQSRDVGDDDFQPRRTQLARKQAQAEAGALTVTPLSARSCCNSPAWNISRMMSQPPTNSPLT